MLIDLVALTQHASYGEKQLINSFNLSMVLVPDIRAFLKTQQWYPYIPDVHNVSMLVNQESSDQITIVLSGASMFFDVLMLGGCISKIPQLLDAGCLWHYFDLGADLIVGFASANYTRPVIVINKSGLAPVVQSSRCGGLVSCYEVAPPRLDAANATFDDGASKQSPAAANSRRGRTVPSEGDKESLGQRNSTRRASDHAMPRAELLVFSWKESPYSVLLEPPTVRQCLHFTYVTFRAFVKCQMLKMYGIFVRHYKK
ncbi:hypothetical protein MRX96_045407 [Rhipicephalus microplus]